MAQVYEELKKNSFELKGNVVDVCEILREDAKRYKGITVSQYLRLRKIQKAEEEQLKTNIWS